jgi:dipeptidyl aminopeptidase/acylaminoacyl peptidase
MNTTTNPPTIQPEDLFRLQFLQEAQFSPDGQRIAYTVSWVDAETDAERSAIWLLTWETGETQQLTVGLARDTNPQWSPDGRQIAFLSTRADQETAQLYRIPVDGGEAQPLTDLKQGVAGGPVWSPDGKYIAFTARRVAEPPDPQKPYRVTRHIYRFDALGYLDHTAQDIYVIASQGGEPKRLTDDGCHNTMPLWAPDGREILYTVSMFPESHRIYPGLRAVNSAGEIREIIHDWGYVVAAAWTPDGTQIVFIGKTIDQPIGAQNNLWIVDRAGGQPECRTADLPFQVGGALQPDMPLMSLRLPKIFISPAGEMAYVQVQVGGTVQIYRIALQGPESCQPVIVGERACFPLDMNAQHLLYLASTLHNPTTLLVADLEGGDEQALTTLNADYLAALEAATVEPLTFPGGDGVQVEGWLMRPPHGQAPYPTVLYIHGGPHSAFGHLFSFDFQMLAGAGYAVLFINHRASTGYGDEFSTKITGDWGNLDYQDLMAGVDYAIEQGLVDPDRLGCAGLSGGGNLSCWIVGQTDRFKAAVPENPVTNWVSFYGVSDIGPQFAVQELGGHPHEIPEVYQRCSPITYAHRCTTPTLLIQGEADYRCPAEQSEQFYAVLKASGCIVEMVRLPESPHAGSIMDKPALRRAQNEALLDWLNRYVLGIKDE